MNNRDKAAQCQLHLQLERRRSIGHFPSSGFVPERPVPSSLVQCARHTARLLCRNLLKVNLRDSDRPRCPATRY